MTEREQFEAWAAGAGFALHKVTPCDGSEPRYDIGYAHDLWIGWQARAVLAQPVAAGPEQDPDPFDDRKDAERYRWLRSRLPGAAYRIAGVIYSEGGAGVDAAIDAARAPTPA